MRFPLRIAVPVLLFGYTLHAQDRRNVTEPTVPLACATLLLPLDSCSSCRLEETSQ